MAKMTIDKGHFNDRVGAMQDIQHTGYWPHTFVSGASPELPIHRHDHDVIGYVVEGETFMVGEDLLLRLFGKMTEHPAMLDVEGRHPSHRRIAFAERETYFEKGVEDSTGDFSSRTLDSTVVE